ncbi:MAG: halocarboxylic acid dehydrogenase DehI family protein [Actinomycetota bacterium]|nr:halocarboxylic acid dehydrogenase DehI family protein [Actinomycetota bacterium]
MTHYEKFPQVDTDEAGGQVGAVYQDIQDTLRVPWVAFACRVLATFPGYLPRAWEAAGPSFSTRYAERAADALRERALLPGPPPPDTHGRLRDAGWDEAAIDEVRRALDALNYGNPKYLLLLTAWCEAFQDRPAGGGGTLSPEDAAALPRGLPEGVAPLHLVEPAGASSRVRTPRRVK